MKRFRILLRANFLMFVRNRRATFFSLIFPIGLTLLFGAIWGKQEIKNPDETSFRFMNYLVASMIVMSLLSNGVMGSAFALVTWRERGIFRRIQATPLPVWQMLLARILVQALMMVIQAALLVATAVLVFQASFSASALLGALPAVLLGAVLFMAIGIAIAAMVSKVETAQVTVQFIYFPLMFLGGLAIPLMNFPEWLRKVGMVLPTAMVADLVRAPLLGAVDPHALPTAVNIGGALAYFVVALSLGARFFRWR